MKLDTFFKLILLSHSLVAHHDAATSGYEDRSNDSLVFLNPRRNKNGVSDKLLYVVWIMTEGGPSHGHGRWKKACTGTLIRNDLVMSLASCMLLDIRDDPNPDITRVFERPGRRELLALKIFIDPNYYSTDQSVSKAYDFGLIVVEKSKQKVFPRLPTRSYHFEDIKDTCLMGGYGGDDKNIIKDEFEVYDMNETTFNIVTGRGCLNEKILCVHLDGIMPCTVDIGAPLICDGVIYALYTPLLGRERRVYDKCLDIYITSFSLVYNVKEWVTNIMDEPTSNLEWLNNPCYVLLLCCTVFIIMGTIYYGLVEVLQRYFDPADHMQTHHATYSPEDEQDDEDSWYGSQWVTR